MNAFIPKSRRKARVLALQALYAIDLTGKPPEPCMESVFTLHQVQEKQLRYARLLVQETLSSLQQIDPLLEQYSKRWTVRRMAVVDRNLLRMAVCELLHHPEVPPKVILNEAIEIAKDFCEQKTPSFINAILDKIQREVRAQR